MGNFKVTLYKRWSEFFWKRVLFLSIFFFILPLATFADISSTVNAVNKDKNTVEKVKIFYIGHVTVKESTELIMVLDEVNSMFPKLNKIYLYINSSGGNMESGYMVYEAIKSSLVPVTTINIGMVASSATLFYCGAQERFSMPAAYFLFHPAGISYEHDKSSYIKPNLLELIKEDVRLANNYFRHVYHQCTNYKDEEINKILYSDDNSRFINTDLALKGGFVTKKVQSVENTDISSYIYPGKDGH